MVGQISGASLLDEATAAAEAMTMCSAAARGKKPVFLVSVRPHLGLSIGFLIGQASIWRHQPRAARSRCSWCRCGPILDSDNMVYHASARKESVLLVAVP